MNSHRTHLKTAVAAAALAAAALLALLALSSSPAGAAKPKMIQCEHPLVVGKFAINPKGISGKKACVYVRALGKYLSTQKNIEAFYECKGATPKKPGRPVLLQNQFEGWNLRLFRDTGELIFSKPGQSFRVAGQDFPVNCS